MYTSWHTGFREAVLAVVELLPDKRLEHAQSYSQDLLAQTSFTVFDAEVSNIC